MNRCSIFLFFIFSISILISIFTGAVWGDSKTKIYDAKRLEHDKPKIDGRLDDAAWKTTGWGSGFIQKTPSEGDKPTFDTTFKILYDKKHLYVGIRALDNEPAKIERRMTRRDEKEGDWVEITLDSYGDNRTGFSFSVNASGVKKDELVSGDGDNRDASWDPIWHAKVAIDGKGWTAEIKIPFSQLRFGNKKSHTWGLYVSRFLHREQEQSEWKLVPRDANGFVSWFGQLRGLKDIKSRRPIELLPYIVGQLDTYKKEEGNRFADGTDWNLTGGLDGKIGITNDLTLDFTINPDFGQVEADPSEVNLTAYETFFQEKRPFFIEGRNILDYKVSIGDGRSFRDNLFYSRRIGKTPYHYPRTGANEYADVPGKTSILGAFKLTGKTRSGLSIGILESITAKENAEIDGPGQRRTETVEPLTNYFVLRMQKDFNQGNSSLGGIFTATNRDLKGEDHLKGLHSAAYTGGLDFYHRWNNKAWTVRAKAIFSHVRGSEEAIMATQLSPVRYFQRPDADHLDVEPGRTSLTGYGGDIAIGKDGGGPLRFMTSVMWRSPGLELNDVGYQREADKIMQWSWVGYQVNRPFGIFRFVSANLNQWNGWNFGGDRLFNGGNFNVYMLFKNYWAINVGMYIEAAMLSPTELRGGPMLKIPAEWNPSIMVQSDPRQKVMVLAGGGVRWGNSDSKYSWYLLGSVSYRPNQALSISFDPSFEDMRQDLQYVDTVDLGAVSAGDPYGGKRYVFGTIRQKMFEFQVRVNYSITPDLSIQFYGQPFIATGAYSRYKYITQPRADEFRDRFHEYGASEIAFEPGAGTFSVSETGGAGYRFYTPDFKFLQFRSNLVVRWEYSPGSTVYLVWSQGRTDAFNDDISFSPGRNLRQLFQLPAHDVFLLKFTYRVKI